MPKRPHLGELEELVLLVVERLGDDARGARIRGELRTRAGRSPTRGGKAKRHYAVTPAGRRALERARAARELLRAGVGETVHG